MAGGSTRRRSMTAYSGAGHAQGTAAGDERMERYHEYVGRHRVERSVWPGAAFVVEALLLLVFLAGSLAVLMELNADADAAGQQSADLMEAMTLASNAAEEFAANPELAAATGALGDEEEAARVRYGTGLVMTRTVEAGALAFRRFRAAQSPPLRRAPVPMARPSRCTRWRQRATWPTTAAASPRRLPVRSRESRCRLCWTILRRRP